MLRAAVQQWLTVVGAVAAMRLVPQPARSGSRCRRRAILRSLAIGTVSIGLFGDPSADASDILSVQTGSVSLGGGGNGSQTATVTITAVNKSASILFFNYEGNSNSPANGMVRGSLSTSTTIKFTRTRKGSLSDLTLRWYVAEFASGVSVQRKTSSVAAGINSIKISAVDPAKSFVLLSGTAPGQDTTYGNDEFIRARITSATNLELSRNGGAGPSPSVDWQVVEFAGATVQRGTASFNGGQTSRTVPITAVDLSRSLVLLNWKTDTDGTGLNFLRARLTSPTQITLNRGVTGAAIDYAWEVIEFTDGTSVQSGDLAFSSSQTSRTAALTTIDVGRSVALLSTAGGGWGGSHAYTADDEIGPGMFTTTILDSLNLGVSRATTGAVAADASWFVVQFAPCIPDPSGVSFDVPTRLPVGKWPRWIVAADLDGDSDIDLASANSGSHGVSVLLNDGSANFADEVRYSLGAGSSPVHIASGDVDNDGDIDLVTANRDAHDVAVLKNNGDGTFASATAYPAGTRPTTVVLADLDGDGDLDIAACNRDSADCSVFLNDGTGSFGVATSYTLGTGAHRAVGSDVDGDGDIDLIVGKNSTVGLAILLNDGTAGFSTRQLVALGRNLNGDGKTSATDFLLFDNCFSGSGVAYPPGCAGVDSDGDGDVDNADFYLSAWGVVIDDLDGDGNPDLIVANPTYDSIGVLNGLEGGAFGDQFIYATDFQPVAVAAGDVDGDGDIDLVSANLAGNSVSVLLRLPSGNYAAPVNRTVGVQPRSLVLADLDGDSDLDIVTGNYGSASLSVLLNTGGTYLTETRYASAGMLRGLATGDLNGDGFADVVTADYNGARMFVSLSNGDGTLGTETAVSAGDTPIAVALDDLNGDGNLDMVSANLFDNTVSVRFGAGDGTLGAEVVYAVGQWPIGVTLADIDDDGDRDLITVNRKDNTVSVLLNDGLGVFGAAVGYGVGTTPVDVVVADVNRDGMLDVVTGNRDSDDVSVLLNSGTGTFVAAVSYAAGNGVRGLDVADIDGDGYVDVITANRNAGNITILLNNTDGTFAAPVIYAAGTGPTDVVCRDLDGDCDVDILVANMDSDDVSLFENIGGGVLATQVRLGAGDGPYKLALGDLDNDDRPDLVVISAWSNEVALLMNNSLGTALAMLDPSEGRVRPLRTDDPVGLHDPRGTVHAAAGRTDRPADDLGDRRRVIALASGGTTMAANALSVDVVTPDGIGFRIHHGTINANRPTSLKMRFAVRSRRTLITRYPHPWLLRYP